MFTLERSIKFYVPSTIDTDQTIDTSTHCDRASGIARQFAAWFGGSTQIKAIGHWLTDAGQLVSEEVTIVYSFADRASYDTRYNDVIALGAHYCRQWAQESIAIEFCDRLVLVSPEDAQEAPEEAPEDARQFVDNGHPAS